jgi:hypothetical protein
MNIRVFYKIYSIQLILINLYSWVAKQSTINWKMIYGANQSHAKIHESHFI